jgi:hypothetical protein
MENYSENFNEVEKIANEMDNKENGKKMLMGSLDKIRQGLEEKTLTDDDCRDALYEFINIAMENNLLPEECPHEQEALTELLAKFAPLRKAAFVNTIVGELSTSEEIDGGLIVSLLVSLKKERMSRKQIKKAVNKHLTVERRKAFTKLLNELGAAPDVLAMAGDANKRVAELFDGVESKPVSRDDAHEMIVDCMSHWTTHLVKTKTVVPTVTFQKGDQRMCTNLFYRNYAEKAANLTILRSHVQGIKPDAIVTVDAVWAGSKFAIGEKLPDKYMPSTDPNKREGLMVLVETPADFWLAVQMFSRGNDGEIVLEELLGPDLVENPEGNFVFMKRSSAVTA